MKTNNEDLKSLRAAQDAVKSLRSKEVELRNRHQALVKERESTHKAKRSLDEIIASMKELVDKAAAGWAEDRAKSLVSVFSGYWDVGGAPGRTEAVFKLPHLPTFHGNKLDFRELCGLAPDLMKTRLEVVIRASGARFGLPADERIKRLAELDEEIALVESMHSDLVAACSAVDIALPYLPAVQERRNAEARQQEVERERAAAREAGVFVVSGYSSRG